MYSVRQWSVRNARLLAWFYDHFEGLMVARHPLWLWLGYDRVEGPIRSVERYVKSVLFDCRMCGNCVLGKTGMSCPMNCPKSLRNGPCGGVRPNGHCEVEPAMRCVWVEGWNGAQRMCQGHTISEIHNPLDHRLGETSSWLRVTREQSLVADADSDWTG